MYYKNLLLITPAAKVSVLFSRTCLAILRFKQNLWPRTRYCQCAMNMMTKHLIWTFRRFQTWVGVAMTGEYTELLVLRPFLSPFPAVLYCYDFVITLPDEISEIWPTKWSLTKATFLLSRYGTLVYWILGAIVDLLVTNSNTVSQFLDLFGHLVVDRERIVLDVGDLENAHEMNNVAEIDVQRLR